MLNVTPHDKPAAIVYGIKNIAGTTQEILAIMQGTHNSKNNIHAIVDDVKNLPSKRGGKQPILSEFQPITRDFAFIVDVDTPSEKLTSVAQSADSRITNVVVFDAFDMGDGKKSIAFTITIEPRENMSDSDLQALQTSVIESVEKKCNATIRDK